MGFNSGFKGLKLSGFIHYVRPINAHKNVKCYNLSLYTGPPTLLGEYLPSTGRQWHKVIN